MALCHALGKVVRESLGRRQPKRKAFGKVDNLLTMAMMDQFKAMVIFAVAVAAAPVQADSSTRFDNAFGAPSAPTPRQADQRMPALKQGGELAAYLQCVPYARQVSGIQIFGDAHSWWAQAQGRYATGKRPQVGAVLAFVPHRSMQLGHVAAVSRVIDSRTVLLDHANWSPINGRRGQIERDVRAIDVSPGNDWSQVRVWYDPAQSLGTTVWPTHGFIYSDKAGRPQAPQLARVSTPASVPMRSGPSKRFEKAFSGF